MKLLIEILAVVMLFLVAGAAGFAIEELMYLHPSDWKILTIVIVVLAINCVTMWAVVRINSYLKRRQSNEQIRLDPRRGRETHQRRDSC